MAEYDCTRWVLSQSIKASRPSSQRSGSLHPSGLQGYTAAKERYTVYRQLLYNRLSVPPGSLAGRPGFP